MQPEGMLRANQLHEGVLTRTKMVSGARAHLDCVILTRDRHSCSTHHIHLTPACSATWHTTYRSRSALVDSTIEQDNQGVTTTTNSKSMGWWDGGDGEEAHAAADSQPPSSRNATMMGPLRGRRVAGGRAGIGALAPTLGS